MKGLQLIFLLFSLIVVNINYAQHNHGEHTGVEETHDHPPHHGEVMETGKYSIELVKSLFLKNNQLQFYIFKGTFKPVLTDEISGSITVTYEDGSINTTELIHKGNDHFVGHINKKGSFQVEVTFLIKGKKITSTFIHKSHLKSMASHVCSMHPEIVGGPGENCPKCGMTLQKKK